MDLPEAKQIAESVMRKHGLSDWVFKFNRNKRRLGVCKQDDKRIELSEHYVLRNDRQHVTDTILHEVAHAIVGTEHGHDDVWKNMCTKIGATPSSCSNTARMPDGYWQARCPGCYTVFTRHRRPRRLRGRYCVACGPDKGSLVFRDMRVAKAPKRKLKVAASEPPRKQEPFTPKQLVLRLLFG
jgi:predicted SprT family Zn-dependent metalloprotease